ncbi:MAG: DUF4350 domain-containing protein [Myxococcota bacterium]
MIASPARAEDYAPDAEAWNGIGYLVDTAGEAKVDLEMLDTVDLDRLRPGDVLLWLHPTRPLPVADLLSFVTDGGHLVVADDRGRADALLEVAGMHRLPGGPEEHGTWYQGQEGIPLLRPDQEHFLFFNVEEVAANYPAALRGAGRAVLSFDGGREALVMERRLGEGTILAIADPSMFINEMLRRFYGNKQFAANVMRLYCEGGRCAVSLVLPGAEVEGGYRSGVGALGRLPVLLEDAVTHLNGALERLNGRLGVSPWVYGVVGIVVALLGLALAGALRRRRRAADHPPLDGEVHSESPIRQQTRGLVAGQQDADFVEPARTLVEEMGRLARSVGAPGLLPSRHAPEVAAPGAADDPVLRNALLRIRREAASLQRSVPPVVSAERFLRLLSDVRTVSRHLDPKAHAEPRSPQRPERS